MYNQDKFIEILKKCKDDSSLNEYARLTNVDVGYLSRILNKKRSSPPSPAILKKIADTSKNITSYEELMETCGYLPSKSSKKLTNSLLHPSKESINSIPLFTSIDNELCDMHSDVWLDSSFFNPKFNYFAYQTIDNSMAPLLNTKDIAIIQKNENNIFENGKTYLLQVEKEIIIRKIIRTDNFIELQAMNPYYPIIKITEDKIRIIGKVIKAEVRSAFE